MPRIRCPVAMSLDGYIAGPQGGFDWIVEDPAIDFEALFAQFDTFLMGRRTVLRVGQGIQLLPQPATQARLQLTGRRIYPSGIVMLEYSVKPQTSRSRRTRSA